MIINKNNHLESLLKLCKKYGFTSILAIAFLFQNYGLNQERIEIRNQYTKTLTETVKVLVIMDERLRDINSNLEKLESDINGNSDDIKEVKIKMEFLDRIKK